MACGNALVLLKSIQISPILTSTDSGVYNMIAHLAESSYSSLLMIGMRGRLEASMCQSLYAPHTAIITYITKG